MAGPDLTAVTRAAEQYLDDRVRVTLDPDRIEGGALDPITGLIGADVPDVLVHEGPALLAPDTDPTRAAADPLAAVETDGGNTRYKVLLPLSAPELDAGQVVQVLTSRRDPLLAGRRFRVAGGGAVSTYAVLRVVPLTVEA